MRASPLSLARPVCLSLLVFDYLSFCLSVCLFAAVKASPISLAQPVCLALNWYLIICLSVCSPLWVLRPYHRWVTHGQFVCVFWYLVICLSVRRCEGFAPISDGSRTVSLYVPFGIWVSVCLFAAVRASPLLAPVGRSRSICFWSECLDGRSVCLCAVWVLGPWRGLSPLLWKWRSLAGRSRFVCLSVSFGIWWCACLSVCSSLRVPRPWEDLLYVLLWNPTAL